MKRLFPTISFEILLLFTSLCVSGISVIQVIANVYEKYKSGGAYIFELIEFLGVVSIALLFTAISFRVFRRTLRGKFFISSVAETGLFDIENRDDQNNSFPPPNLFDKVKREVFISAYTAKNSFQDLSPKFEKLLDRGIPINLLLLYPDRTTNKKLFERELSDIAEQIFATLSLIKKLGFYGRSGFNIRFMREIPPYTAVMIDGDINNIGHPPRDNEAHLRVEPASLFAAKHKGVVLHFIKLDGELRGVLDYFADDIRKTWATAEVHPELFEKLEM